jgi:RNA recognition motif-containing protein
MGCDYDPKAVQKAMRGRFFALVAGQLDHERLRKDGLNILLAVRAHGIQPPHILQNRLIDAWESSLPEQVLSHFTRLRERAARKQDFSTLSSAMCRCIMADMIGSTNEAGRTCHVSVDAAISHNGATCDVDEETSAVEETDILHTATERTPLRREASTFVPKSWEYPWQMPPETSMLCNWAPYAPSQYDEFLQMGMQQMGSQCDERTTVMLRNLPGTFLREDLITAMDAKGFAGLYNFVYIPIDFQTERGKGYGFVNFISAEEAQRFMPAFDGFRDWSLPSSKICSVDLARTQGLDANVRMYRHSAVMGDKISERFRPVLFDGTQRVPFPEPTRELEQMESQWDERTTVMLRNLPCPFLRDDLINAMDAKGFAGLYNFVYIPTDFQRELSKGYGFVNFISAEEVQRFMLAFDGFRDWPVPSSKVCSVDLARTQGLHANVRLYRNSAVMGDEVPERFRPVLFDGTQRVPFPEPTRELLGSQWDECTTMMLRNLPCPVLREDLFKEMHAQMVRGSC